MKRVECDKCINFIDAVNFRVRAKCRLGKRVMFRYPKLHGMGESGYFRYCEQFSQILTKYVTNKCHGCGVQMQEVRPGKWQCNNKYCDVVL